MLGDLITEDLAYKFAQIARIEVTTASGITPYETPAVPVARIAPRSGSRCPPPMRAEDKGKRRSARESASQAHPDLATTQSPVEEGLGWAINKGGRERESRIAREILDTINADTLHAARLKGGIKQQIKVNRDRISALLELRDDWKRPDEVYADETWEICIVWRSSFGKVEIGTEEDGSIGYFVSRTLSEKSEEGKVQLHGKNELERIFSWLEADPEDI